MQIQLHSETKLLPVAADASDERRRERPSLALKVLLRRCARH
jgi:hypothetical protein